MNRLIDRGKSALAVVREVGKNLVMGSSGMARARSRMGAGRTMAALDVPAAVARAQAIFRQYLVGLAEAGWDRGRLRGAHVVEIGPGPNLAVALQFIAAGAGRVIALDRFPELRQRPREIEIYARLMASFSAEDRVLAGRALRPAGVGPGVDPQAISYLGDCPIEASGTIAAATADLVVSHVALEYVWDLDAAVAAIRRILRPGGLSIHVCSLASQGGVPDHEDRPLGLLEYSPRLWRLMFSNRGVNRVRASELRKRFIDGGLDEVACTVLQALPLAQVQAARPLLHGAFAALSDYDLATLRLRLVSRKLG